MRALRLVLPLAALAALAAFAWPRGERADDELLLVSPHWEGIKREFGRAFRDHWREQTGRSVRVTWLDLGGTGKCVRYVKSKPPGGVGADVFFGGGADRFISLAGEGYLAPVELPAGSLSAFPPELGGYPLRDAQNRWFAACLSNFGISFNREVLRRLGLPEPREWLDLADPRLVNWVGSGEPRSSGTVHMTYELILQSHGWRAGWAIVTRMAGNVRSFTEGGNGIPRDVAMGQFAAGGAIDFYALEKVHRLGPDCMGFSVPRRLLVVNGDPVGMLAGAPHRRVAEEFVRFALSAAGQRLWYLRPGEPGGPREFFLARLPVRPAAYAEAPPELAAANPFAMTGQTAYDVAKASRRWAALDALLGAAVVDAHDELRGAWRALLNAGLPAEGLAEFGSPPCSEEEFLAVADKLWNSRRAADSQRNDQAAAWSRWALAKYRAVERKWGR